MAETPAKADSAFRTIGELSTELGLPQHILRYWETRFPQLRPLQRAGNRRYYRPEDVTLVKRIHGLLNREGYTVRGVQKLLAAKGEAIAAEALIMPVAAQPAPVAAMPATVVSLAPKLRPIREMLVSALAADA